MAFYSFAVKFNDKSQEELAAGWIYRSGCDGLEENNGSFIIYFQTSSEKNAANTVDSFLEFFPDVEISEKLTLIKNENWNENWKSYFKPLDVGLFNVRAPWHQQPETNVPIIIYPKMAFGTGTHETTQLILRNINGDVVKGKRVLDIGCGSGILSIAAEKMGAKEVLGVDIDEDSINNARENAILNQLTKSSFSNLPIDQIKKKRFEVIFANIIASVLIKLPQEISRLVVPGGIIFLSGLLEENLDEIEKTYSEWGLKVISKEARGEWFFMELKKEIE